MDFAGEGRCLDLPHGQLCLQLADPQPVLNFVHLVHKESPRLRAFYSLADPFGVDGDVLSASAQSFTCAIPASIHTEAATRVHCKRNLTDRRHSLERSSSDP